MRGAHLDDHHHGHAIHLVLPHVHGARALGFTGFARRRHILDQRRCPKLARVLYSLVGIEHARLAAR
jgi:hypothetical protein